jgi:hypothetical protein
MEGSKIIYATADGENIITDNTGTVGLTCNLSVYDGGVNKWDETTFAFTESVEGQGNSNAYGLACRYLDRGDIRIEIYNEEGGALDGSEKGKVFFRCLSTKIWDDDTTVNAIATATYDGVTYQHPVSLVKSNAPSEIDLSNCSLIVPIRQSQFPGPGNARNAAFKLDYNGKLYKGTNSGFFEYATWNWGSKAASNYDFMMVLNSGILATGQEFTDDGWAYIGGDRVWSIQTPDPGDTPSDESVDMTLSIRSQATSQILDTCNVNLEIINLSDNT